MKVLRSGNNVGRINEVTLCRARLVPGWVTVFWRDQNLGMLPATQTNSTSYPQRDGERISAKVRCLWNKRRWLMDAGKTV